MTILAAQDTRNSQWASSSSYGRKMLEKMGWKGEGSGLGKNQQGNSLHLRAVRRAESLGIGAETDAFGEKGWSETNKGFHGVLASLKKEYGRDSDSEQDDDSSARKKRRKEEKKRRKKEEKRKNKEASKNGARLAQNKVQAGHARKMREAKDLRNKSAEDMAAIFGVKADLYKKPLVAIASGNNYGNSSRSSLDEVTEAKDYDKVQEKHTISSTMESTDSIDGKLVTDSSDAAEDRQELKKKKKKKKDESKKKKKKEPVEVTIKDKKKRKTDDEHLGDEKRKHKKTKSKK